MKGWSIRGRLMAIALVVVVSGSATTAVDAQATTGRGAPPKGTPSTASPRTPAKAVTDTDAADRAFLAKELQSDITRLATLRTKYLQRADWADLGDRCNPGSLRVFPRDTTPEARAALQAMVEEMEKIIVRRGAGARVDTPEVRALVRIIVGWEAGIDRPLWDMPGTAKPREAFATGLTGDVPDPNGPGCLPSSVQRDTVTFVVPGVRDMEFPKAARPRVKAYLGADAQAHARSDFFTTVAQKAPTAVLRYSLVAPIVLWRDYATVGVRRPAEVAGAVQEGEGQGGAVYLFRRVGTGWRLLAITRAWGE